MYAKIVIDVAAAGFELLECGACEYRFHVQHLIHSFKQISVEGQILEILHESNESEKFHETVLLDFIVRQVQSLKHGLLAFSGHHLDNLRHPAIAELVCL